MLEFGLLEQLGFSKRQKQLKMVKRRKYEENFSEEDGSMMELPPVAILTHRFCADSHWRIPNLSQDSISQTGNDRRPL